MTRNSLVLALLASQATASLLLPRPPLHVSQISCRRRGATMQADTDQPAETAAAPPAATVTSSDQPMDLSAMTFEERLEYLAANSPTEPLPKAKEEEEEGGMFGFDLNNAETQWWRPEFIKLCLEDLGEMQWPTTKQTLQTVTVSQAAFVLILIFFLIFDAVVESGFRTLLQGKEFSVTIDSILKKPV